MITHKNPEIQQLADAMEDAQYFCHYRGDPEDYEALAIARNAYWAALDEERRQKYPLWIPTAEELADNDDPRRPDSGLLPREYRTEEDRLLAELGLI